MSTRPRPVSTAKVVQLSMAIGTVGVRISKYVFLFLSVALPLLVFASLQSSVASSPSQQVRRILKENCLGCHGPTQMAGLDLRDRETILKGGTRGPALIPGDSGTSLLYQAVAHLGDLRMPPNQDPLSAGDVETLRRWIDAGADWDPDAASEEAGGPWWSFRKPELSPAPGTEDPAWTHNPIDAIVLARLEEHGLTPAPEAPRLTLLRRAKFDLHGLPPTIDEIEEFLSDTAPGAFARLVDRLLASPRYGERWGRHWLDVARYADSTGLDEDLYLPEAWRYRDYVIDAFNADVPYDRFIVEQVAGDLLAPATAHEAGGRAIVATGFLALGPKPVAQQDKLRMVYDVLDEQIDTLTKAFLGLTVACARCHDHKFDPITTRDYYSLVSIFASTKNFVDVEPKVSEIYFAPLVSRDEYQRYRRSRRAIEVKQKLLEATEEIAVAAFVRDQLLPRFAVYMVAARRLFQGGEDLEKVARELALNPGILGRWVDYLNPRGDFRPYLEDWRRVDDAAASNLATEYRAIYEDVQTRWTQELKAWKDAVGRAAFKGEKLPVKPSLEGPESVFSGEDDMARFFAEVTYHGDTPFGKPSIRGPFAFPDEERDSLLPPAVVASLSALRKEIQDLEQASPPAPPMACAVAEGERVDQRVLLRGNPRGLGDPVPKQFPVVLAGDRQPVITRGSGRKELAEWLTRPDHALTSRVMVNRIWQWHFGEGLVRTPNNFGTTGEPPTHPELLDTLAVRFVRTGWSIKSMHRLIMLSNTYRMSSRRTPQALEKDPDNRLLSRFDRRRLSVEEMRDSFLAVSGALDLTMGGKMETTLKGDAYPDLEPGRIRRRSVYFPLIRNKLPSVLRLFDFVDPTASTARRTETNIAPQALFMMNSDFIHHQSRTLAEFLLASNSDDMARMEQAYGITLGRKPGPDEAETMLAYVRDYPGSGDSDHETSAWQSLCRLIMGSNEFHYVE